MHMVYIRNTFRYCKEFLSYQPLLLDHIQEQKMTKLGDTTGVNISKKK